MINALFRLKGLFGFKVNCRVLVRCKHIKDHSEKVAILRKFYKTEDVLLVFEDDNKRFEAEVTYF